jgi:hypothetical protein
MHAIQPPSAAPFDTGLVIDRLRKDLPGEMRHVGGAADYASVRSLADYPAPCVYVLLAAERGQRNPDLRGPPGGQWAMAQMVDVTFAVVMVFRNYRQLVRDDLRNELRDQVGAVRARLLGWTPPLLDAMPCQLDRGDLGAYDAAVATWIDIWSTRHPIKVATSP